MKTTHIKRLILAVITAVCLASAGMPAVCYAAPHTLATINPRIIKGGDDSQSSFEYKKYYSLDEYKKALEIRMNDVAKAISSKIYEDRTLPIPGLTGTITADGEKSSTSYDYVPQGLCRAGDHLLVTAYDSEKKNSSVIYAVDTEKNVLTSTVAIPNKYHVGGIAFDGKRIWLTGNTSDKYKGSYFVQYIDYDRFLEMTTRETYEMSESEISDKVYIKNKPSFLECDSGRLWVGTYIGQKGTAEAYMNGYTIMESETGTALNTTVYSSIKGIDSSAQGADIDANYLYVSSSYKGNAAGVKSSFITRYEISPVCTKDPASVYADEREVSRVEVPKMNEEIAVEKNVIYINFESAANVWKCPAIVTDRILAVNKSVWGIVYEK